MGEGIKKGKSWGVEELRSWGVKKLWEKYKRWFSVTLQAS
jgi:hypothetical protein